MIDFDSIAANASRRKIAYTLQEEVSNYVNTYESDNKEYNSFDGSDSSYEKLSNNIKSKISSASSILAKLEKYKNLFDDDDYYSNAKSAVSTLSDYYTSSLNTLNDKKIRSKYKGASVQDIDNAIAEKKNSKFFSSPDNQRELKWLTENRDSFMTTDELKSAIEELEGKSGQLKKDKWKSGLEYAKNSIVSSLSGTASDPSLYTAKNDAKSAETENSEKLDRYKKLLTQREDVSDEELEKKYKEADSHSIFDVLKSDYTYTDYENDKSDKRIYGSAYTQRKDAKNSEIIKDNADEFESDVSRIETIIYNKTAASDTASSSLGNNLANVLNSGMRREEIMNTDSEIQSIVKKWADRGYDFNDLFDTYERQNNAEYTQSIVDEKSAYATEHPIISNIESVGTNLIGGISALPSAISSGLKDLSSDDVVNMDTNSSAWTLKNVTDTIRNTTAENLENSEYGELKSFLYQTGMSTADFLTTAAATGFAEPATLLLMGSNAAVDTMKTVSDNGGSASDAMIMGVLSGVFETLCEKVSVETIFKSVGTTSGRNWLYNIFKGFVSEGSEELATDLLNTTVDILLNADQSEYMQSVYSYMRNEGLSASEASSKVFTDNLKNMALSFAGGALSGGIMAGAGGAIGLSSANRAYNDIGSNVQSYEGGTDAVMQLAREIVAQQQDTDNTISNDLKKAEKKSSAKNVGRLYADVQSNLETQTQTAAKNEAINGIKARVEELGLDSSTSKKAAEIIYKAYSGENLTARQKSILYNNKYVSRAYRELLSSTNTDPSMYDEETGKFMTWSDYTNEWTQDVRNNAATAAADVQSKALSVEKYSHKNPETEMSAEEKEKKTARISGTDTTVTVDKIVEKTDTGFIAELTNGDEVYIGTPETVSETNRELDTVSFKDTEMNKAIVYASNYESVETANAFLKAAATVKDTAALQNGFNEVYLQGLRGEEMNTNGMNITTEQAKLAYISGTEDAKLTQISSGGRVDGVNIIKTVKENSYNNGVTRLDTAKSLSKKQSAQLNVLDAYGKKHGISFVTVDSIGTNSQKANGAYIGENKIMISLKAEGDALLSVAGHEVYHYIKRNNKTDAEAIRAWVIDRLKKNSKYDYDERFKELAEKYGTEDVEAIEEEMTANAMFEVLNNEDTINELAKENPSLLEKIAEAIKNFVAEMKQLINGLTWKEAQVLKGDKQALEDIRWMFNKALNNISKNTAHEDGGIKFSLMNDNSFEKNVDNIITMTDKEAFENKEQGNFIRVMNYTPAVILENVKDAQNCEVIIRFDALYLATRKDGVLDGHYHNLGAEIMKNLPEYIRNPDAIVRMNNGRLNIFATMTTEKGNKGIISMEMNTVKDINSKYDKYNLVVTVFSANDNYIKNNLKKSGISVEYIKKDLSQVNPQLYEWLAIVNDKSSDTSISQDDTPVNTQSMQKTENDTTKFSYASVNAKSANVNVLEEAKRLEKEGTDSETIRQQTGWFKGYDGKWRFEIDDSKMKISTAGLYSRNPDIRRYRELEEKIYFEDTATDEDRKKFDSLKKSLGGVRLKPSKLGDLIDHEKLFAAYPELQNINVKFESNTGKANGWYDHSSNEIVINKDIVLKKDKLKSVLIHEIQHAIQDIEGFARGSNPEYWQSEIDIISDTIKRQQQNLDMWLKDIGYNEYVKESMNQVVSKEKTLQQHWKDIDEYKQNSKYAEKIRTCENEIAEYKKQYESLTSAVSSDSLYKRTAGEIEARDTSKRVDYDSEKRKNTRPDIDSKDVVFAEGSDNFFSSSEADADSEIKFSLQETASASETREQLLKENSNLRVANTVLKNELKLTKGKSISMKNAKSLAKQMINEFSSKYDSDTLAQKLYDIFRWYDSEDGNADYVVDYISTIAKDVIAQSTSRDTSLYDEYADARERIRNLRFALPDQVLKQMNENYDGKFRQKTFGKMKLVSKEKNPDVMYLSAMYSELANEYPNFFSVEDNEYEQPQKLLDFWEAIQPTYTDVTKEMGFESENAAAVGFAYMTFEKYLDMPAHETFADKKQKEIDSLKKEYSRNLNEAKKKFREDRDTKVEQTQQYYRDMISKQRARRMETQAKAKMRKDVVSKVKKLSDMLTKPTDNKHIPDQLKNMVARYLMLFTDDSAIFNEAVINRVTKAYTQLIEEDDGAMEGVRQYYDPDILLKLNRLSEIAEAITDGNRLAVLDVYDMNTIAEITDHFYHLVKNANEVFIGEKKKSFNDIITNTISELHGQQSKAVKASFEATSWDMTPYYFFKKIGGMFNELFTDLLDGQHKYGLLMAQAREHMQALGEKYKISSWQGSNDVVIKFTAGNGENVELTADEALGIYAIAKRESISDQESKHLTSGGIVFKGQEAIPLSVEEINRITDALTEDQIAYADETVEYLSTVVGGWGNEASLKMYGYKKFNESWYYPFHTAENYKRGDSDENNNKSGTVSLLKNKSFTKSTVHGAATPVIVENFTDVVGNHIGEMISYNTLAQPQSTLNAVYKYNVGNSSVRAALEEAYGSHAKQYVETLIKDITNGATYDPNEDFANKMISRFKMNAVAANLSVIVQQPSAIGRALAVIDPKYFLTKSPRGGYEECKKYSGVAVIKEIGGFDTSTGKSNTAWIMKVDPEGAKNKAKAFVEDSDYRNDKFGWAAGKADELTWAYIWQAVKAETADKLNIKVSELTEEQLYDAGKRFNEVIEATQVYDSVLTRSQFMRGKTTWTKMASAFMAEPTKRINMLYDALYEFSVNKNKESGKYLMRTIGGVLVATLINTVLKSFISAGRDDDENQAYMEKYIEALIDNSFSELSILQGLPIIKDIVSILQGYDITRTDMDIVINAVDAVGSMVKFTNTVNDGEYALMTDKEKFAAVADMVNECFGSLGAFIGLPTKNIGRDLAMLVDTFQSVIDDKKPTSTGMKYSSTDALIGVFNTTIGNPLEGLKVNENDLYKDMLNGDEEAFAADWDEYQAYLIYSGKTEEKAYSTVRSNVKDLIKANLYRSKITDEEAERYLIEYLGNDDGYWVVKEWRFNTDDANEGITFSKYLDLEKAVLAGEDISDEVKELTEHNTKEKNVQTKVTNIIKDAFDEGTISEDEAQKLLTKYVGFAANQSFISNSIESDTDINRIVDKWSGNKDLPDGEYYTSFDALNEAVIDGTSIESAKERLYELDYSDSEINEQIRSTVKEAYIDGTLTKSEASSRLQKYTDMSSADAADKLNYWNFKNSNPDSELSEAGVKKYLEAQESGISLDIFEGYYSKVTKITGDKDSSGKTISGSKKAKILDLINSLPISSKQKDILYYQNNYTASTLYEAPWH